jgi:hypothetical protein
VIYIPDNENPCMAMFSPNEIEECVQRITTKSDLLFLKLFDLSAVVSIGRSGKNHY